MVFQKEVNIEEVEELQEYSAQKEKYSNQGTHWGGLGISCPIRTRGKVCPYLQRQYIAKPRNWLFLSQFHTYQTLSHKETRCWPMSSTHICKLFSSYVHQIYQYSTLKQLKICSDNKLTTDFWRAILIEQHETQIKSWQLCERKITRSEKEI